MKYIIILALLALVLVSGCIANTETFEKVVWELKGGDWIYLNDQVNEKYVCGIPIGKLEPTEPQTPTVTITEADTLGWSVEPSEDGSELFDRIELFVFRYYLECRDEGKNKEQCETEAYVAGVKEFATPPPEPDGTVSTVHTEIHEGIATQPLDNMERV